MNKMLILICCLLILPACVADHGHFTVLTNKLIDAEHFKIDDTYVSTPVVATSRSHIISSWQLGGASLPEVIDKAMRNGHDADILTNVKLRYWAWYVPSIYGQTGWGIRGEAISSKK